MEEKHDLLKAYRETFGHCCVPKAFVCGDSVPLGRWVKALRRKRAEGALSLYWIHQLDLINFCWFDSVEGNQMFPLPSPPPLPPPSPSFPKRLLRNS